MGTLGWGTSTMDSSAYDTAWVARLAPHFEGGDFDNALPWLRHHQHTDGSWGAGVMHYHDRIISTLSAIIALRDVGQGQEDEQRIRQAESFLWRENDRLRYDANDTGGFPLLVVWLVDEAAKRGLDVPPNLSRNVDQIEKKLKMLGSNPKLWRYTTVALSLEAMSDYMTAPPDFMENNGSVGVSPAATAATMLSLKWASPESLDYLRGAVRQQGDGGVPFVTPMDIFETSWALNHFRLSGVVSPDHPDVRRSLEWLWQNWSAQRGVGFSSYFSVPDLDDTAVTFSVLRWGGYPVDADVFAPFEQETHFECWPGEADPSLSVHIRTLAALHMQPDHPRAAEWSHKIRTVLGSHDLDGNGYFWFDKWHISPYYLTSTTIWSLSGVMNDLLPSRLNWILKTQQADGGWGYYQRSTAEETAYCLSALLFWDRYIERVDSTCIEAAASYLIEHMDDTNFPALWIGKCLYMPRSVVQAAILSALHSYALYKI